MQSPPASSRPWKIADVLICLLIFLSAVIIYWPVRSCSWIDFDDPQYVFANPHVLLGLNRHTFVWAFTSSTGGLWQPLTMLSYLLDVRLLGPNSGAMHLENVFLHAGSSVGWYLLLVGMTGARLRGFFVAGLFALHPAHVESVAWITERKDVLSMFFLVLSLLAYWRYTVSLKWSLYACSLLLFALALMAKAMMVTQPALMLLLDLWPLRRTRSLRQLMLEKIPFVILAIAAGIVTLKAQATLGATPDLLQLSIYNRIATSVVGYVRYLGTAFVPRNLAVFYPYQFDIPFTTVAAAGILLAIITYAVFRLRHRRPYLAMGWVWYLVALSPVIGFTQAGSQSMADRFTYLPFAGLSIAVVWSLGDAAILTTALGTLALLACAVQTRSYLPCWSNTISIFTRAAQVNVQPDWVIEYHLGAGYAAINRPDLAIDHYESSLQVKPNHPTAQINLANLLMRYSPAMALPHYQIAVQLSPGSFPAHYNYALCLEALKQNAQATAEFARAQAIRNKP